MLFYCSDLSILHIILTTDLGLAFPFNRWENWITEREGSLPQATQHQVQQWVYPGSLSPKAGPINHYHDQKSALTQPWSVWLSQRKLPAGSDTLAGLSIEEEGSQEKGGRRKADIKRDF